jgi:hypothetical protein
VLGSCEHGNELSGFMKGEFLDELSVLLATQEGPYSMELAKVIESKFNSQQRFNCRNQVFNKRKQK